MDFAESAEHRALRAPAELGLMPYGGRARIAPVSREMILNFVAQHSLGLPRSY